MRQAKQPRQVCAASLILPLLSQLCSALYLDEAACLVIEYPYRQDGGIPPSSSHTTAGWKGATFGRYEESHRDNLLATPHGFLWDNNPESLYDTRLSRPTLEQRENCNTGMGRQRGNSNQAWQRLFLLSRHEKKKAANSAMRAIRNLRESGQGKQEVSTSRYTRLENSHMVNNVGHLFVSKLCSANKNPM